MSIPKVIHYCWFGRTPKPRLVERCMKSWLRFCPDYEIVEWNEDNFDIDMAPLFVRQAYEAGKWAFVTDYVRLQVIYENGGIYLDTDVELCKCLDPLLAHKAYFGFEGREKINTGHGFGAEKGTQILRKMMESYLHIPFLLEDGSCNAIPCPQRDTEVFLRYGLVLDDSVQVLADDILILPTRYLCPIDYLSRKKTFTPETISIHWFNASWKTKEEVKKDREYGRERRWELNMEPFKKVLKSVLGDARYYAIKEIVKGGRTGDGEG